MNETAKCAAVELGRLTRNALDGMGLTPTETERCKNFFALGMMYWLYDRPMEATLKWIEQKFAKKPKFVEANHKALHAGNAYAETAEIFEHPANPFVMDFLGQVDHVDARVARTADGAYVARLDDVAGAPVPLAAEHAWRDGEPVVLAFRTSDVRLAPDGGDGHWPGTILSTMYLGERIEYVVQLGTAHVRASGTVTEPFPAGAKVHLEIPAGAIRAWPARS